jgi:hypothetical protein
MLWFGLKSSKKPLELVSIVERLVKYFDNLEPFLCRTKIVGDVEQCHSRHRVELSRRAGAAVQIIAIQRLTADSS